MQAVKVNIINKSSNPLPSYSTEGSAGMDIRANLDNPVKLMPLERSLIPTGIYVEIPAGYEMQVRPRSGLAIKQGITCLNTPGTIDSDYRGEIKIIIINLSNEQQVINHGDRIAQLILASVEKAELLMVQQLNDTDRAAGGFGHTGLNN